MDSVTTELLKLGLPGIVILGLAWAVVSLYRARTADSIACANTIAALQESRLQETKKTTEAFINATTALNNQAEIISRLDESLRGVLAEWQARGRR
jgi:uncharacterized membrane protein (DUF2068 family)